jgi:hypothetical protein
VKSISHRSERPVVLSEERSGTPSLTELFWRILVLVHWYIYAAPPLSLEKINSIIFNSYHMVGGFDVLPQLRVLRVCGSGRLRYWNLKRH